MKMSRDFSHNVKLSRVEVRLAGHSDRAAFCGVLPGLNEWL
jgi:hypothetical protein